MRPEQIRNHLRKEPFEPIRVFLSDGSMYDIPHPELAIVSRAEVIIALQAKDDDLPESFVYCDPVHITRIEPINGKPTKRRNSRRK